MVFQTLFYGAIELMSLLFVGSMAAIILSFIFGSV